MTDQQQPLVDNDFPMTLNLTVQDINFILNALGDLPSKTGAFSLIMKIKSQGDAQVPQAPSDAGNKEK